MHLLKSCNSCDGCVSKNPTMNVAPFQNIYIQYSMSRCGSYCLKQIIIPYGLFGDGSGIRQALAREIPDFKRSYPSIRISLRPRVRPENKLTAIYNDGSHCSIDISRKSSHSILSIMHELLHTANDEIKYFRNDSLHFSRESVQGPWNPYLFMGESHQPKKDTALWDRKLSDEEWEHYVQKYSSVWENDQKIVNDHASSQSKLYAEESRQVKDRWKRHITQDMPTDMEDHANKLKKLAAKKTRPKKPSLAEYSLFSSPCYSKLGSDALSMLRSKQSSQLVQWWNKRREQLKSP